MSQKKSFTVDPDREDWTFHETGIFVRAWSEKQGKWVNADISTLDATSALKFLTSRGGENKWAEATAMILLGWTHDDIGGAEEELGRTSDADT